MLRIVVFLLVSCFVPSTLLAASAAGVNLPDNITLGEKALVLNGLGVRKATWFKVKVYVGALYLEQKSKDAAGIVASDTSKKLTMHFVRDVGVDKLVDGWNDGFKKNGADMSKLGSKIDQFNATMSDIQEGQQIELEFVGDLVDVSFAGTKKATIEGKEFQQALLSIWLGTNPPNEDLKQGLLGRT